jgi:hypothetical protein
MLFALVIEYLTALFHILASYGAFNWCFWFVVGSAAPL